MPTVDQIRQGITGRSSTMTCAVDGRDHLVSAQATEAGSAAGQGRYLALCGHLAVAAALVVPPGPTCRDCETALRRITTAAPISHRRPRLLARLLRRRLPSTNQRSTTVRSHRAVRA